ncbi:GDA1/CD39 (nucleoside phosphatase) family [Popillia japonica]|uniref:GDA1/CD39 (Nucleoside phosphatase) family n=1 Tax=Popillia japonica TaxID=7064 RepID=A0AAW1K1P4_POPJA
MILHVLPTTQKEQNGQSIPRRKKKTSGSSSLRQSLLCLIVSGVTFTVFMFMYIDYIPWHLHHRAIDKVVKVFGYYKPVHAVVIDAGSTGSRVLAFTFHQAYLDGHLILDKELFVYTKPGLSSYADNPEAEFQVFSVWFKRNSIIHWEMFHAYHYYKSLIYSKVHDAYQI